MDGSKKKGRRPFALFEHSLTVKKGCCHKIDDKKRDIFPQYLTVGSVPVNLDVIVQGVATEFW